MNQYRSAVLSDAIASDCGRFGETAGETSTDAKIRAEKIINSRSSRFDLKNSRSLTQYRRCPQRQPT